MPGNKSSRLRRLAMYGVLGTALAGAGYSAVNVEYQTKKPEERFLTSSTPIVPGDLEYKHGSVNLTAYTLDITTTPLKNLRKAIGKEPILDKRWQIIAFFDRKNGEYFPENTTFEEKISLIREGKVKPKSVYVERNIYEKAEKDPRFLQSIKDRIPSVSGLEDLTVMNENQEKASLDNMEELFPNEMYLRKDLLFGFFGNHPLRGKANN